MYRLLNVCFHFDIFQIITIEELARIAATVDSDMLDNHDPELEKAWEVYESILSSPNSSTTSEDTQLTQVATPGGYSSYDEMDNSPNNYEMMSCMSPAYSDVSSSDSQQVAPQLTLLTGYQSPPAMTSTPVQSPKDMDIKTEPDIYNKPPPSYEEHIEMTTINKIKEEMIEEYRCEQQRHAYPGMYMGSSPEYGSRYEEKQGKELLNSPCITQYS